MAELKENYSAFTPHVALKPPSELISKSEKDLSKAQTEFDLWKSLLKFYAQSKDPKENEKAVDKYKEIKEKFPAHPGLKELETDLKNKGILKD